MLALILVAQIAAAAPVGVPATPRTLSELALERRLTGPRSAPGTVSIAGAPYDPTARDVYQELAVDGENRRAAELEAARVAEPVVPAEPYVTEAGNWYGGWYGGGIHRRPPRPRPHREQHVRATVRPVRPLPVRGMPWQ